MPIEKVLLGEKVKDIEPIMKSISYWLWCVPFPTDTYKKVIKDVVVSTEYKECLEAWCLENKHKPDMGAPCVCTKCSVLFILR